MVDRIALATHNGQPHLGKNDRLLLACLSGRNINSVPVVWDAPEIVWSDYDAVVLRSTWDYYHSVDEYIAWLNHFDSLDTVLLNPANLVVPNLNKKYLLELREQDFSVVPSCWVPCGDTTFLVETLNTVPWKTLVVKPSVGASAHQVIKFNKADISDQLPVISSLLKTTDILIQPFLSEIGTNGEWSFIFFNGRYSHAVLKQPAENDFRVQGKYGGVYCHTTPNKSLLSQAEQYIEAMKELPVYARVDAIEIEGQLMLMELELNEPCLFFDKDNTEPAHCFVDAILEKVA